MDLFCVLSIIRDCSALQMPFSWPRSLMHDGTMSHCVVCKKSLPTGTRAGALYCHTNCRSRAFRQRHRCDKPTGDESADPHPRNDRSNRTAFAKTWKPAPESAPVEPARRVAMERQLLAQAPPEAAGYRLVLPPRAEFEEPGYVPTGTGYGQPAWWTLRPFQLPDDDRLLPGRLYKVVWVDAQGARVPPTGSRAIPCLHYFLGAAETESERADEYEALLKLAQGTSQESAVREEIMRQRLREMKQATERAQPSARPQPPPSEVSSRESEESLRKQIAQMAREMEELRRPKSAPPRPPKKESPDSALLWGGAALLGLLIYLRKSQALASPTTPPVEKPTTQAEAVVVEPGLETSPESEIHEPKRAAEQSAAYQTPLATPAERLPTAESQPNPSESTDHHWTGPPPTQAEAPAVQGSPDTGAPPPPRAARVPMNEDQAIAAVSEKLLRLFWLQGPHDPAKA